MNRLTLTLASGLALAAASAQAQDVINIGVQPATQPIYIAKAAGYLDEIEEAHDVDLEFKSFSYGAPENQAMAAGEIQMASAGMGPAIVASARLEAKLLAITVLDQTAILVQSDSDIATIADLEGKTVAYPGKGSQQYPLLIKALSDAGLEEGDIRLFKTKGSDVGTLLAAKRVDAGVTWDPHVSGALANGSAKVLMTSGKILPIKGEHYIGNGFYARNDFMDAYPEVTQAVVDALVRAENLILDEPETAMDMWAEEVGVPREVIEYSITEGISVFTTDITPEQETIDAYTQFLKDAKILEADDAPKIDTTFAEKASNAG
ncbi:ABC transporter substrate-binding protein [Salipiger mucosus]|uniref:ABC-type nitrate/sulfonate/bicarbonate transport system, periplasmic component n=1 Tax=Salipiger mucosus DSM 16094 TaxID=1123237 RepID=S9Q716_9RHOB|nr:NrtA/SsuA/CpmA family ABC transporter substrate-binding protein [Salipiger mucosus]EPX75433.1 ABC-type nitrate/sulfonate/bicarbonate transport system, periplasmic component [Salipiger mucosus DSM 16094]